MKNKRMAPCTTYNSHNYKCKRAVQNLKKEVKEKTVSTKKQSVVVEVKNEHPCFTRLKGNSSSTLKCAALIEMDLPSTSQRGRKNLTALAQQDLSCQEDFSESLKKELIESGFLEEDHKKVATEAVCSYTEKTEAENQTDSCLNLEETYMYKLALKLFALDRSQWPTIEIVLDLQMELDGAKSEVSQEGKQRIIDAAKQWHVSCNISNKEILDTMKVPLTSEEEKSLDYYAKFDWTQFDSPRDLTYKRMQKEWGKLLLREYLCWPHKTKPTTCKHCNKTYTASTSLHDHLVATSGIRFWICSKCRDAGKSGGDFTRKHSLRYHILNENQIPRYVCKEPGCSKTHNHSHHHKNHAKQHAGQKSFLCAVVDCEEKFSNRNTYSRHLLQYHDAELLKNNQIKELGANEASQKIEELRLKARHRSQMKRLQSSGKRQGTSTQDFKDTTSQKRRKSESLSRNIHFSTESHMEPKDEVIIEDVVEVMTTKTPSQQMPGLSPEPGMLSRVPSTPSHGLEILWLAATLVNQADTEGCILVLQNQ